MDAPPKVVLWLPAGTVGLFFFFFFFFFVLTIAFLNSFRRAGDGCMLDIALRKAS